MIRGAEDTATEQVRIRIWKHPLPDYDSTWSTIVAGEAADFTHGLGGKSDNYVLDMQFQDNGIFGVNQTYYGGNTSEKTAGSSVKVGAFWYGLNTNTVNVLREESDLNAEKVRIRIWVDRNSSANNIFLPVTVRSN